MGGINSTFSKNGLNSFYYNIAIQIEYEGVTINNFKLLPKKRTSKAAEKKRAAFNPRAILGFTVDDQDSALAATAATAINIEDK